MTPLSFLADYRGYLQADAFPGLRPAVRRRARSPKLLAMCTPAVKFVEAAELLKKPGRPHEALAFYKELFRIERQIEDLSDEERLAQRQRCSVPIFKGFKTWLDAQALAVLPKSALG